MARPHIEPFVDTTVSFKPLTLRGMPAGQHFKMLSLDTDTGACSLVIRYQPGYRQPPGFSRSALELFLMEGTLTLGDRRLGEGHYLYVPAGVALPALRSDGGARALVMYNDSAPDFIESDADENPLSDRAGLISRATYEDMSWQNNALYPSTAPGCLLKTLRYDPHTHAMSFLYFLAPHYHQTNVAFHDCVEEGYHIWGTTWMMQFGDLPTGGYFYRPPYVNHGPFACTLGSLGFGRTDGDLYNHYHANPFSQPADNRRDAGAKMALRRPNLFQWVQMHGHNHLTAADLLAP